MKRFTRCSLGGLNEVHIRNKGEVRYHKSSLSPPVKEFFTGHSKAVLLLWILFVIFVSCFYHAFLSVHCRLVVACWERANLFAILYVMFSCVFVTFPCDVGVSVPDLCLLT